MPIPKELMPQSKHEKQKSDKPKSDDFELNEEQNNIKTCEQGNKVTQEQKSDNLTMKKRLNWHYLATHVLPIFIVILLLSVGAIAAVPSWRNSFNKFIAKWSPKADVSPTVSPSPTPSLSPSPSPSSSTSSCTTTAYPTSSIAEYNGPIKLDNCIRWKMMIKSG